MNNLETDEIDTYVKLKIGYPLTVDSFMKFPDTLAQEMYSTLYIIPSNVNFRKFISIQLEIKNPYWTSSTVVWNIIREYHEKNQ